MFHVKQRYPFEPDYRVAPGETLREWMEENGMTLVKAASLLPMTALELLSLINGASVRITPLLAASLEKLTGIPAQFWLNLEANYRAPVA